ncbi:MAG TPA: amidase [Nitrolancea sp.]|nr:amidase [Nitrolancea sp.]
MSNDLIYTSVSAVAAEVARRAISPVELTRLMLERAERLNPRLNAFITITAELALQQARRAEDEIVRGNYRGPLHGIPYSLKDLVETRGIRTTAGSPILNDFVPERDATVYERLNAAGAILLGKNNMLEFAYGSPHPDFGVTPNPWNLRRGASGSSSGSAVATAAGIGYGSIGSDTAGSIRIPAAWSGIVGLKPTNGRTSLHGIIPLGESLDTVGPLTRTVRDAAIYLNAIAGYDPHDPYSINEPVPDYLAEMERPTRELRVGLDTSVLDANVDPQIVNAVHEAATTFQRIGIHIQPIELPDYTPVRAAAATVLLAEASAYHQDWLNRTPKLYSDAVRSRLQQGMQVRGVDYVHARGERFKTRARFMDLFETVDAILTPVSIINPMTVEEVRAEISRTASDPVKQRTRFTAPLNLLGLPGLSLRCGETTDGLPIGMQLIGRPFGEGTLLALGHRYEQETGWPDKHPEW